MQSNQFDKLIQDNYCDNELNKENEPLLNNVEIKKDLLSIKKDGNNCDKELIENNEQNHHNNMSARKRNDSAKNRSNESMNIIIQI